MPTTILEENTAAIAQNTAAIADVVHALQVEVSRARAAEAAANSYTDETAETLNAAIAALDDALRAYVDSRSAAGMHYKGSVATVAALPATGNAAGDMYNVAENGRNYVWDGTAWDDCGGIVDTSSLVPLSSFNSHVGDTVKHVTAAERALWNSGLTFAVGTVSALAYGAAPTVRNVGTARDIVLNFGIPRGKPFTYDDFTEAQLARLAGPAGPAPVISIGSVDAGENETDAGVEVASQTGKYVTLAFRLPRGPQGDPFTYADFTPEQLEALRGPQGEAVKTVRVGNVSTVSPSAGAMVTVAEETATMVKLDFRIPRGYSPYIYASAQTLAPGQAASANVTTVNTGDNSSCTIVFGIPQGDPGYIGLVAPAMDSSTYQLVDDASNLINVTGSTTSVNVRVPYEYRSSNRTEGAHEFTIVLAFASTWTGATFALNIKKRYSSDTCVLHLFSANALDFTGAQAGDIAVVHFAEMFEGHYMVSTKFLAATVEVTQT